MTKPVVVCAILVVACGGMRDSDSGWRGDMRDSAGVVLVFNRGAGLWTDAEAWRTSVAITVGVAEGGGADDYMFGLVTDVATDRQQRLYVLDQQARAVKLYDSTGTFLTTIGRPGEGPGELSRFATAVLVSTNDTLYVPDYAQTRINMFLPDGSVVGSIRVPSSPGGRSWVLLDDGRFVFRGLTVTLDDVGRFQSWDGLLRTRLEDDGLDTLLIFNYEPTEIGSRRELRVPLIINNPFWDLLADGSIAWSALDRERVYIHGPGGGLERVLHRSDWRRTRISESDRDALVELLREKLELLGGDARMADGANVEVDEFFPAITGIRAGPDGTLWVQRMGDVTSVDPMAVNARGNTDWLGGSAWDVFDGEGRFLGELSLPHRFRVTRITASSIVGVVKDTLGVERVTRLRLDRPAS